MKLITALFVVLFTVGCASNGTGTLGNGEIDIDLGDGKLFGSEKAYVLGVTAAQYAVYRNPVMGESIKAKLNKARSNIATLESKYPTATAAQLALDALRTECGFWCNTVAGQEYLEGYITLAEAMVSEADESEWIKPQEFLDELLSKIDAVEAGLIVAE